MTAHEGLAPQLPGQVSIEELLTPGPHQPERNTMTPDELDQIRDLAQRATPGPWLIDSLESGEHGLFIDENHPQSGTLGCASSQVAGYLTQENAAFIAAADPHTVLALIAEVDRLRTELTTAKADAWDECAAAVPNSRDAASPYISRRLKRTNPYRLETP